MLAQPRLRSYPPRYTLARWHEKYPNPYASHVVSVDTVSREIDLETGILRSERVIGVKQGAPKWITKVICHPTIPSTPIDSTALQSTASCVRTRDSIRGSNSAKGDNDERELESGTICVSESL